MDLARRTVLAGLGGPAAVVPAAVADRGASPVHPGSIRASRTRTVVGAPVTVQGPTGVRWELERTPRGSEADLRDPDSSTTSVRPDVDGRYVVAAVLEGGRERVRFRADDRSDLADRPSPDHEHVDATVEVYTASVGGDALTVHVGVKNWGPKPHPYRASVETEPPEADWDDARLLADERFRVGTDREGFARADAGGRRAGNTREARRELTRALPDDDGSDWNVRVRVRSDRAGVRAAEDFHDERTVDPDGVPVAAAARGGGV